MTDRHECEAAIVANLDWLRRTAEGLCRRRGLGSADAEDFTSWLVVRLLDDECAVLRRFRGESALRTYLTVVTEMFLREYRVRHWGRWRPSAAARRGGPLAVRLETLVHRDGLSLREAVHLLAASGTSSAAAAPPTERDLRRVYAALPRRAPVKAREVACDRLELPAAERADERVAEEEAERARRLVSEVLRRGLESLPAEDRTVVWMHYWEGATVADIARRLGLPQKPLYRRLERSLRALRDALDRAGVPRDDVRLVLDGAAA